MFAVAVLVVAVGAGSIAAIGGFGIGSLLTPMLAVQIGAKTAVAAVSVAHLIGTALRFWSLRSEVDRAVLWRFGIPSAAGSLAGALLHASAGSRILATVFGALLVFAGISQITERGRQWRLHGTAAWLGGALSGVFGGLVGNQGGIRSAALLGFELPKRRFVATATAIGLVVDGARMPVYLVTQGGAVAAVWPLVVIAIIGVVAGTLFGNRLLGEVPERRFRATVGVMLIALGSAILIRGRA
jgi:uncharacterized protein